MTELVADGRGGTEYRCWETMGGVLAPVVKFMVGGTLVTRFEEYADGLREFCAASGGEEVEEEEG